jgi:hypothetical protein
MMINNKMSKFDLIFEKAFSSLRERHYIDSAFVDNVRLLVKVLKDSDYLPADKNSDVIVDEVMRQRENVKEIVLDTKEQSMPPVKLQVKQGASNTSTPEDSENFSVTVIDLKDPSKQKEFTNSMLETVFADTLAYIKTITLQGLSPDASVDKLPSAEGANAQPEGGESALPAGQEAPAQPNASV